MFSALIDSYPDSTGPDTKIHIRAKVLNYSLWIVILYTVISFNDITLTKYFIEQNCILLNVLIFRNPCQFEMMMMMIIIIIIITRHRFKYSVTLIKFVSKVSVYTKSFIIHVIHFVCSLKKFASFCNYYKRQRFPALNLSYIYIYITGAMSEGDLPYWNSSVLWWMQTDGFKDKWIDNKRPVLP